MPRSTLVRVYSEKDELRFWSKVQRHPTDCWLYMEGKSQGYGMFFAMQDCGKTTNKASRVAYTLAIAQPGELNVCHTCDNPPCVRPSHLFLGTDDDNLLDRDSKGRNVRGARVNTSKLSVDIVMAIRASVLTHKELASIYGVHPHTIYKIKARKDWKHV